VIGGKTFSRRDVVARYIATCALGVWLGGLTFYALVVIPSGASVVGDTTQGFITQRVTGWLNWIGVLALVALLPSITRRWMIGTWVCMGLALAVLFAIHVQMDAVIDAESMGILNRTAFASWHQKYLLATTFQWLAGMVHLWGVVQPVGCQRPAAEL